MYLSRKSTATQISSLASLCSHLSQSLNMNEYFVVVRTCLRHLCQAARNICANFSRTPIRRSLWLKSRFNVFIFISVYANDTRSNLFLLCGPSGDWRVACTKLLVPIYTLTKLSQKVHLLRNILLAVNAFSDAWHLIFFSFFGQNKQCFEMVVPSFQIFTHVIHLCVCFLCVIFWQKFAVLPAYVERSIRIDGTRRPFQLCINYLLSLSLALSVQ